MAKVLTSEDTKGFRPTKKSGNLAPDKPKGLTQNLRPKYCRSTSFGYCESSSPHQKAIATHRVTILGPSEAAKVNKPEDLCSLCAANAVRAYIGYGWGVQAILL